MESLHALECFQSLCKYRKMFGLYVNYDDDRFGYSDIKQAIPFLTIDDFIQSRNIFLFDTEEDCRKYYGLVVGDDSPTKSNKYNGEVRVYALTCDNNGEFITENT